MGQNNHSRWIACFLLLGVLFVANSWSVNALFGVYTHYLNATQINTTYLSLNGSINFNGGNNGYRNLMYFQGGEDGLPLSDGFRINYLYDFEAANDDWLIFNKVDGNDAAPDGGIGFMMTGNTNENRTILKLDGYGVAHFNDTIKTKYLNASGNVCITGNNCLSRYENVSFNKVNISQVFQAGNNRQNHPYLAFDNSTGNFNWTNINISVPITIDANMTINYGDGDGTMQANSLSWTAYIYTLIDYDGLTYRSQYYKVITIIDDGRGGSISISVDWEDVPYATYYAVQMFELDIPTFEGQYGLIDATSSQVTIITNTNWTGAAGDVELTYPNNENRTNGQMYIDTGSNTPLKIRGSVIMEPDENGNYSLRAGNAIFDSFITYGGITGIYLLGVSGNPTIPSINIGNLGTGFYTTDQWGGGNILPHSLVYTDIKDVNGIYDQFKYSRGTALSAAEKSLNFWSYQQIMRFGYFNQTATTYKTVIEYNQKGNITLYGEVDTNYTIKTSKDLKAANITATQNLTTGTIKGSGTTLGCTVLTGANTACTTTCGNGCLFGQDTAALTYAIVSCSDATADRCLCCKG